MRKSVNHQVCTLKKWHTLVPSPPPPLHSIAWDKRSRGNSLKRHSTNFSTSLAESRHVVCDDMLGKYSRRKQSRVSQFVEIEHDKGKCMLFYCCFGHYRMLTYKMWDMYNLVKAYRSIKKSIANRRVKDREANNSHTKDKPRLFHGPCHDLVGKHTCAQPFRMWNRLRFH